jgi:hypothetical protein
MDARLVIPDRALARRADYYPAAESLYDNARTEFTVFNLDRTGAISDLLNPQASFNHFFTQTVSESDRERTQFAMSSEANKLYVFGREHRIYTFTGTLFDTDLTRPIEHQFNKSAPAWTGRGVSEWVNFYENFASLHAAAKNHQIVRVAYAKRLLYGCILQTVTTDSATLPHKAEQGFTFYAAHVMSL